MLRGIAERLHRRSLQGNLRLLKDNGGMIDLASNDYLGLARSPMLAQISTEALSKDAQYPQVGSTGSRLLTGNSSTAEQLEAALAQFHGFECGVLFNSGYTANLGLVSALAAEGDSILYDSQIHASTRAGIALSSATAFPFRHNDLNHLEERLKNRTRKQSCYICVESIYSTDGSMAPLADLVSLSKKYEAHMIVDEAHAVGIHGPKGRGVVAALGLENDVAAVVVTFGKALGAMGAIVLGSSLVKRALINFSEPYIYTTALPLPLLKIIESSYAIFPELDKERHHLQGLIHRFQHMFGTNSVTTIQPIPTSGTHAVKALEQRCHTAGFDVRALTSPTVRRGHEQLRICLHAFNTEDQLSKLKDILK